MKKTAIYLIIMVLSFGFFSNTMRATEKNPTTNTASPNEMPAEIKGMYNRLAEIKAMDKSLMTAVEKKELRKEVRTIKTTLQSSKRGVYLSVGGIIIIILLLILLL